MAIPDFQSIMLPLLLLTSDGKEHSRQQSIENISLQFRLTDSEKKELLPSSSTEPLIDNRVSWARTYLSKAGLLERTGRGKFQITQRGIELLESSPSSINVKVLRQFPEFLEWQNSARKDDRHDEAEEEAEWTPQETFGSSYQKLRINLGEELLERISRCPPQFFEQLVVDLLVAMGYGGSRKDAGEAVGQSGDGGVDGVIKEDRLGLDALYIQAKRWDSTVGRPVVQGFSGSLDGFHARKGVLITTSQFSKDAIDYVDRLGDKKIVLIDGVQLANLLIDYGIGVTEVETYSIKKIDLDYFPDE